MASPDEVENVTVSDPQAAENNETNMKPESTTSPSDGDNTSMLLAPSNSDVMST